MPQLVSNLSVDNQNMVEGAITGNGAYHAYISAEIATNNNKACDADLTVHSLLPDRDGLGGARVSLVMERKDDAGNWHPFAALHQPIYAISYGPTENGGTIPSQQLAVSPSIIELESGRFYDITDGFNTIAQRHPIPATMPDKVRFCVLVHETKFGQTGAFSSLTFSLDYELRAE